MGKIKMLVMDVDGTLTDGKIYMSGNGEMFKAFDIKDGYTIYTLSKIGVRPVIITGRESEIVRRRAEELKITDLYQGVSDKLAQLRQVARQYSLSMEEIAYIGDDYNDLDCIRACGFTGCPHNAEEDIKSEVDYVCRADCGEGAVREFVKQFERIN